MTAIFAPSIPAVKEAIREVDAAAARALADKALALESAAAVRALLAAERPLGSSR